MYSIFVHYDISFEAHILISHRVLKRYVRFMKMHNLLISTDI